MRKTFYRAFYETFKRFVKEEDFAIRFNFLQDIYVLSYDKKQKNFYVEKNYKSVQSTELVYQLISSYVKAQISRMQKMSFEGNLEMVGIQEIELTGEEYKDYCELIIKYDRFLWDEPICIFDLEDRTIEKLKYGFSDSNVSIDFLLNILEVIKSNHENVEFGNIEFCMGKKIKEANWYRASLKILSSEGYIIINERELQKEYCKIQLTEKFLDALKKSFYYDFI